MSKAAGAARTLIRPNARGIENHNKANIIPHEKWKGKSICILRAGRMMTIDMEKLLCAKAKSQGATIANKPQESDIILVEKDVDEQMLLRVLKPTDLGKVFRADWLRQMFSSKDFVDLAKYELTGVDDSPEGDAARIGVPIELAPSFPKEFASSARSLMSLCECHGSAKRVRTDFSSR
jgi:hypothetical protein